MKYQNIETFFSAAILGIVSLVGYAYYGVEAGSERQEYLLGYAAGLTFAPVVLWIAIRYGDRMPGK